MKARWWLAFPIVLAGCGTNSPPIPPISQQPYGLVSGATDVAGYFTAKCKFGDLRACQKTASDQCAPHAYQSRAEATSGSDLLLGFDCDYRDLTKQALTDQPPAAAAASGSDVKPVRITLTCSVGGNGDGCLDDASRACPTGFHDSKQHIGKHERTLTVTCNPPAPVTPVVVAAPAPAAPSYEQVDANCKFQAQAAMGPEPLFIGLIPAIDRGLQQKNLYNQCMTAGGYPQN